MKKSMISLAVATAMISLVGCGNQIPDMTQEQQALVVEYAAGEILKYDKNYSSKLNAEVLNRRLRTRRRGHRSKHLYRNRILRPNRGRNRSL